MREWAKTDKRLIRHHRLNCVDSLQMRGNHVNSGIWKSDFLGENGLGEDILECEEGGMWRMRASKRSSKYCDILIFAGDVVAGCFLFAGDNSSRCERFESKFKCWAWIFYGLRRWKGGRGLKVGRKSWNRKEANRTNVLKKNNNLRQNVISLLGPTWEENFVECDPQNMQNKKNHKTFREITAVGNSITFF